MCSEDTRGTGRTPATGRLASPSRSQHMPAYHAPAVCLANHRRTLNSARYGWIQRGAGGVHTLRSVVSPTTRTCVRGRCPRGWIQRGAGGVHTLRSVVSPTTRTCVRGRCPRAVAAPPSAFLRLNAYAWSTVTIVSNAPAAPVEQQVRAHGVGLCGRPRGAAGESPWGGVMRAGPSLARGGVEGRFVGTLQCSTAGLFEPCLRRSGVVWQR
jgi:hypothetical protein